MAPSIICVSISQGLVAIKLPLIVSVLAGFCSVSLSPRPQKRGAGMRWDSGCVHVLLILWGKNYTKYTSLKMLWNCIWLKDYISKYEDNFWAEKKVINHAWHVYKFFEKTVCEGLRSDCLPVYSHMSHVAFLPLGSNHIALFVILRSCTKW